MAEMPDEETAGTRIVFYGRRKGKKLSAAKQGLIDGLLPAVEFKGVEKGRESWLEIGFGGGEHVAHLARANPQVNIIGAEVFINGTASLLGLVRKDGLENVRIIPGDVRLHWDKFPDKTISRFFVLYPDPWPKARHVARRFINPGNMKQMSRIAAKGAELYIASDCDFYIDWARQVMSGFDNMAKVHDSTRPFKDWAPTRYELKAREADRVCQYLCYEFR